MGGRQTGPVLPETRVRARRFHSQLDVMSTTAAIRRYAFCAAATLLLLAATSGAQAAEPCDSLTAAVKDNQAKLKDIMSVSGGRAGGATADDRRQIETRYAYERNVRNSLRERGCADVPATAGNTQGPSGSAAETAQGSADKTGAVPEVAQGMPQQLGVQPEVAQGSPNQNQTAPVPEVAQGVTDQPASPRVGSYAPPPLSGPEPLGFRPLGPTGMVSPASTQPHVNTGASSPPMGHTGSSPPMGHTGSSSKSASAPSQKHVNIAPATHSKKASPSAHAKTSKNAKVARAAAPRMKFAQAQRPQKFKFAQGGFGGGKWGGGGRCKRC